MYNNIYSNVNVTKRGIYHSRPGNIKRPGKKRITFSPALQQTLCSLFKAIIENIS